MWKHLTPNAFYGAALAACVGLALGMALHSQWQDHAGGPQIMAGSAAYDMDVILASNDQAADQTSAYTDYAVLDTSQLPPDSLPVVRLNHRGGTALPAAQDVQRVSTDEAQMAEASSITVVGDFKDDAPESQPAPGRYVTAAYTPGQNGGF